MSEYPSPRSTPVRFRLPPERNSVIRKIELSGFKGYIVVGLYDDGTPGELDIRASKEGTTLSGVLNAFSIAVSLGLQSGIPIKKFVDKYKNMRFEPMGITGSKDLKIASSIVDYVAQWLEQRFVKRASQRKLPAVAVAPELTTAQPSPAAPKRNGTSTSHSTSSISVQAIPMMAKTS